MLALSIVRLVYNHQSEMTPVAFWFYLVNILATTVIFVVAAVFYGRTKPWLTAVPVFMGVVFLL